MVDMGYNPLAKHYTLWGAVIYIEFSYKFGAAFYIWQDHVPQWERL